MAAKVIGFRDCTPQHTRIQIDPSIVLTIYTGELNIGHGAGADRSQLTIEYPVLGFFFNPEQQPPHQDGLIGIIPIPDQVQFLSAVAMLVPSVVNDKTDPGSWE